MVDIVITATSVVPGANAQKETGVAGETIVAGKTVYLSSATQKYMLVDTNSATAEARAPRGIALNAASLNQPVTIQRSGDLTIGATLTAGMALYASDTPGGICPVADIGAGEYVALLGLAKSTTVLALDVQFPNVAL